MKGEPTDTLAAARRMVRGAAAKADVDDLAALAATITYAEERMAEAVARLQAEEGYSWADIARAVGVTRQAAHKRWAAPR